MLNNHTSQRSSSQKMGCVLLIATIFGSLWVIIISSVNLILSWVIEQSIFEVSTIMPDFRWINHAISSGLILIVCILIGHFVQHDQVRTIFRLWSLGATFSLISVPIKFLFVTSQIETMLSQVAAMCLMLAILFFGKRKNNPGQPMGSSPFKFPGFIILFGGIICIPWILWGSLGSFLDTLVGLLVGVVFAWFAVRSIFPTYLESKTNSAAEISFKDLLLHGFVVAVFLLIVVASLATNGSQQLLVVTIPITGWLVAIFSAIWRNDKGHGRLAARILLFLVMTLPLLFFDMDELSPLYTGGNGEVIEWASKAAWYTFFGILTLTTIILTNYRHIQQVVVPKRANFTFLAGGILIAFIGFLIWGQKGFNGDHLFVILKTQANLSTVQEIPDYQARRQAVFEELVNTAETTQSDLRARLDKMNLDYTPYYLMNAIEVRGNLITKLILKNDPSVDRILDNPELRPLPVSLESEQGFEQNPPDETLWNIQMIQADRVVNELGISGDGILIGQTDSGVDGRHPELSESYRGVESGDDYNWLDPWNGSPFPIDISGHGTQTLGVILGQNTGVAPGAQWIGCVNLARNLGNPAVYLECMQFMLAPYPQGGDPFTDGDPSQGAMIVNNSWGCPEVEGCDAVVFQSVVAALKTSGIFMSVAAGNSGSFGCSTVSDPLAIYTDVLTTGSVDQFGNISSFSSIGPVLVDDSSRQKPDLVAPGEGILSSSPDGTYSTASGTSFAAPHVSGVVALMWSANPKLIGEIDATIDILKETVQPYNGSEPVCGGIIDATGAGILDAYEAVLAAMAYNP